MDVDAIFAYRLAERAQNDAKKQMEVDMDVSDPTLTAYTYTSQRSESESPFPVQLAGFRALADLDVAQMVRDRPKAKNKRSEAA